MKPFVFPIKKNLLVTACNKARHASHSQETDALFRAVRAGSPDTVMALLTSPNVDVNAVDEHGNTPLIEVAPSGTRHSSDSLANRPCRHLDQE